MPLRYPPNDGTNATHCSCKIPATKLHGFGDGNSSIVAHHVVQIRRCARFFCVSRHHHDYLNFVTRTFSHPNLSLGFPIISIRTAATTVKHDAAVEAALAAAASSVVVDAAEGHGASIEATAAAIAAASAAAATDAGEFYQTSSCCLSWVP